LDEEGNITIFELEVVEAGSSGTERTPPGWACDFLGS
jgi:hypothetical protein